MPSGRMTPVNKRSTCCSGPMTVGFHSVLVVISIVYQLLELGLCTLHAQNSTATCLFRTSLFADRQTVTACATLAAGGSSMNDGACSIGGRYSTAMQRDDKPASFSTELRGHRLHRVAPDTCNIWRPSAASRKMTCWRPGVVPRGKRATRLFDRSNYRLIRRLRRRPVPDGRHFPASIQPFIKFPVADIPWAKKQ
jgi:hypothetical protein